MKTIITSVKGPPLRRVLCSFLFGAAAFCVVPTNGQAPGDIVWVVTAGNSIAAYNANGTALNSFNLIPEQSYPAPGGIRVSGHNLYVPSDRWACCPNKSYLYALLHDEAYYMFTTYNAATGGVITPGYMGAGRAALFIPAGITQSGPIYVASQGGIAQGESFSPSITSTVMKAPYALAVNGNVLYVTNNSQDPNGYFYISTYATSNGALLVPYFIDYLPTGGLYGLALNNNVFGVNSALYVSVYGGSAPGVYIYDASTGQLITHDASTGQPIKEPFVSVNEPWGIAIGSPRLPPGGNPTLYVASHQDSAIYEFDAINGGQPFGSIELSGAPTNITVEPANALGN
jgi:hypothetical protein